jgi:hypothetical protein
MDKKRRLRIILAFLLFPACIILWLIISLVRNGSDVSRKPLSEHNNLFTKEVQGQLLNPFVYKSKIREPESNYILDNDFHLTVYKLDLKSDKPLSQILRLTGNPNRSYEPYGSYAEESYLKLTRSENKNDSISNVNFRYKGIPIRTIVKNDSLACFYLKFNAFSLSDDEDSDNDVWGEAQHSDHAVLSLAFIKKKKSLYVIMLFKTKDENRDFQPDLLYSMIKQ